MVIHSENLKTFDVLADQGGGTGDRVNWKLVGEVKSVKSNPINIYLRGDLSYGESSSARAVDNRRRRNCGADIGRAPAADEDTAHTVALPAKSSRLSCTAINRKRT